MDDFGYGGSYGGYDANPFAAPATRSISRSRADESTGKSLTGIGLLIQGWSFVYVFVTMFGTFGIVLLTTLVAGGDARPPEALALLIGLAMLGNIVAGIAILVGQCLCLAIPSRSGAKGWIIGSLGCLVLMVVLFMSLGFSANMMSSTFRTGGIRMFANFVVWMWMLSWLAYLICYELFLRKAAAYVGRDDLAQQALVVLIGVPTSMIVQIVMTIILGLLAPSLGLAAGILILVVAIIGLIANIVFGVMHVALLFRLGSAMRQ